MAYEVHGSTKSWCSSKGNRSIVNNWIDNVFNSIYTLHFQMLKKMSTYSFNLKRRMDILS